MENREGNRVTKSPVFVGMASDDLPGTVLLLRKWPDHRITGRLPARSHSRASVLPNFRSNNAWASTSM